MSNPTTLSELIDMEIRTSGPISLANYMSLCLTHPKFGYYKTADPLGKTGDFITAPEISQIFGELIGLWIANCWQSMGSPEKFTLLELGPGRGTLMSDALRVMQNVPGVIDAKQLILLETNDAFISAQRQKLLAHNPQWIEDISELPGGQPLIVIANEFFDALPIRQYQKLNGKWHERAIGLKNAKRTMGLAPTPFPSEHLPAEIRDAADDAVWEAGMAGLKLMQDITTHLNKDSGALLAIDYGYDTTQTGDTFQAIENHEYVDPLANPGKADLTAHVDFAALARAAKVAGATPHPLITQNDFLRALGIADRTETLAKANPNLAQDIIGGAERLVSPEQMGKLFKVLCVSASCDTPYPFNGLA